MGASWKVYEDPGGGEGFHYKLDPMLEINLVAFYEKGKTPPPGDRGTPAIKGTLKTKRGPKTGEAVVCHKNHYNSTTDWLGYQL